MTCYSTSAIRREYANVQVPVQPTIFIIQKHVELWNETKTYFLEQAQL
jgi:hypothetical protein